jgi:hypothetical protein
MRTTLLVFLALCLTACGTPLAQEPDPTPGSVFLAYPPYLQPTADRFSECAIQQSGLSIFLIPDPAAQSDLPGALLQLQLGGEIPNGSEIYQIGEEKITFIVNGDNPAEQLSTEELLAIYTGQQVYWGFGNHPGIEVWSYPNGDALRSLLETLLPGIPRVASQAQIAPDPQGILQKVAANSGAIGYVPGSWLDALGEEMSGQVKAIGLENSVAENLIQPVLVISSDPLPLEVRALLVCLQQPED